MKITKEVIMSMFENPINDQEEYIKRLKMIIDDLEEVVHLQWERIRELEENAR